MCQFSDVTVFFFFFFPFFYRNNLTFGYQPGEEEDDADLSEMKRVNARMLTLFHEKPYCKDACRNNINTSEHRVRLKSCLPTYAIIQPEKKEHGNVWILTFLMEKKILNITYALFSFIPQ